jgi:hypothetical protein
MSPQLSESRRRLRPNPYPLWGHFNPLEGGGTIRVANQRINPKLEAEQGSGAVSGTCRFVRAIQIRPRIRTWTESSIQYKATAACSVWIACAARKD